MGGRGSSGGKRSGGGGTISNVSTKFTASELKSMNRSQLESVARAVFIKINVKRGMSESEADRRARSLMSGNTDAQLRKYISKNG